MNSVPNLLCCSLATNTIVCLRHVAAIPYLSQQKENAKFQAPTAV